MSRAKVLPAIFSKLHPTSKAPYISILFTVLIAMAAPWFGRSALLWVVDMSSIGVSIAYFYTCFTAYKLFGWGKSQKTDTTSLHISSSKKVIALLGSILSLGFISLLVIPSSPAFLGIESRVALAIWIIIGIVFYFSRRKEYNLIPEDELYYLIIGKKKEAN